MSLFLERLEIREIRKNNRWKFIVLGGSKRGKVCYNLKVCPVCPSHPSDGYQVSLPARARELGNRIPVNRKYRLVLRPILLIAKFPALGECSPLFRESIA